MAKSAIERAKQTEGTQRKRWHDKLCKSDRKLLEEFVDAFKTGDLINKSNARRVFLEEAKISHVASCVWSEYIRERLNECHK